MNTTFLSLQDYLSLDWKGGTTLYHCHLPFLCDCPVKFRVVLQADEVTLQCQGKHTHESHDIQRAFTLQQRAAVHQVVLANPLASSTEVRRNLDLQEKAVYVSPTKSRAVARLTSQARV